MKIEFGLNVQAVGSQGRGILSLFIPPPLRMVVVLQQVNATEPEVVEGPGSKKHRFQQEDGWKKITLEKYESIEQSR